MIVEKAYCKIREEKMKKVMILQSKILDFIREFFRSKGIIEIVAPIIGPATDPGIRGAKKVSFDYYGTTYYIMSSAILYKQAFATAFANDSVKGIWIFSPNIRLEPIETAKTGRHLTEFVQIDVELPYASYEDAMKVCEDLFYHVCKRVSEECSKELEFFKRELKVSKPPYKKITHWEAVEILRKKGFDASFSEEIPWEGEKELSKMFDSPFFIIDYPKGSRGFYDKEDEKRTNKEGRKILRDFDMIYPEGYGEAASGAEREYEIEKVLARMKENGEDPEKYKWYMEMLKDGIVPSAGFGIGLERLTRFICGLESIAYARPFAKLAGIVSP
ncbi:MAG: asparagine synthetase A [Candidatus Aenigmatarchaeota archaeon]